MNKMMKGFTLVEIMIVVAIIAILAAVAVPNFVKYRKSSQATACVSNLKQIQAAKEQWLMNNTTAPSMSDLTTGTDALLKSTPTCKAGGTYDVGDATTDPSCSIGSSLGTEYLHSLTPPAANQ